MDTMNGHRTRRVPALAAAGLVGVLALGIGGPLAHASANAMCEWTGGLGCGDITVPNTSAALTATCDWTTKKRLTIPAGSDGRAAGCADVDGFYVPKNALVEKATVRPLCQSNCVSWEAVSPGWHKIRDLQSITVRVR